MKLNGTENANLWLFGKKMLFFYKFLWVLAKKKLHFGKSFLWAAWAIPNHAQLMCSVFWTCCKNLFFVMEFRKIFYINFDTYFLIFFPWISNINLNMPSRFLSLIFFHLILLFHHILRNYIVTLNVAEKYFIIWYSWFNFIDLKKFIVDSINHLGRELFFH